MSESARPRKASGGVLDVWRVVSAIDFSHMFETQVRICERENRHLTNRLEGCRQEVKVDFKG